MSPRKKLIIYAPNIHNGGGRTLLISLLKAVDKSTYMLLDERMILSEFNASFDFLERIPATIFQRFLGELRLRNLVNEDDVVLCLGNLPPIFRLSGKTIVFVQNRYLIDTFPLTNFNFLVCFRIWLERFWLKWRISNVDQFIVQTPTMKRLLIKKIGTRNSIVERPFLFEVNNSISELASKKDSRSYSYDFIYVASGESHKNHKLLIDAWMLLAQDGHFPSLCITVDPDKFPTLNDWISLQINSATLKISNLGNCPHQEVLKLYKNCGAAIYPSIFESFGIPLIEAKRMGLTILAPELDYVRDLLDPKESFDPYSAISISRAVKRSLGITQAPLVIDTATQFVEFLMESKSK